MRKILLLDDEALITASLKRYLGKQTDWDIFTSNEPGEALEMAENTVFEVILTDYQMPGMNGVEFLVFSRDILPDAKRIILSGQTDFPALVNAINLAGIFRFLGKPAEPIEIQSAIRHALDYYDLEKENRELADRVRKQQADIKKKNAIMRELIRERHPIMSRLFDDKTGELYLDDEL